MLRNCKPVRRSVAFAAVLAASGLLGLSPAYAADALSDSLESPALASTIDNPVIEDGKTVPPKARPGFRVLPYLQKPASDQMTINWFSESGTASRLIVKGPGLPEGGRTYDVIGTQNPVNSYQADELSQQAVFSTGAGINYPQGSWIRADRPYKYSQTVTGLQANSTYEYEVVLDDYAHSAAFTTFNTPGTALTEPLHVIAYSDTETEPNGRARFREWEQTTNLAEGSQPRPGEDSAWAKKFGGSVRNGQYAVNYMLTEDMGMMYNNQVIKEQQPDLILEPGDIVERGSSQTHWDEYFRYFAGDVEHILDTTPIFTSLGNHEVYGYGTPSDRSLVVRSRMEYNQYFDTFGSDDPNAMDAYHRIDDGKVTFISLDVTNGSPDESGPANVPDSEKSSGNDANLTPAQYGTDTQNNFTIAEYNRDFHVAVDNGWAPEGSKPDQPNFMPGSEEYRWLEAQLKDAREQGQIIVVQWHHSAYSNTAHGTPMGGQDVNEGQSGVPTRILEPLMEKYGVGAVISGHGEMFEASYVDEDGDGKGVYHWDVGIASDGLRGDTMVKDEETGEFVPLRFNTHEVWSAQVDEPEMWQTDPDDGQVKLVSGGKNYGHLDMKFTPYTGDPLPSGVTPAAMLTMTPIAVFPILDGDLNVDHVERREMLDGQQVVYYDANGNVLDPNAKPEEPVEPSTEPVEPSTQPTQPSEGPTEPSEGPVDPSTEPTEPTAEPTQPTEPSEQPTEPTTEPSTQPSTEPSEPSKSQAPTTDKPVADNDQQDDASLVPVSPTKDDEPGNDTTKQDGDTLASTGVDGTVWAVGAAAGTFTLIGGALVALRRRHA